jgi:uncharacterized protein (TIGR02246 family)
MRDCAIPLYAVLFAMVAWPFAQADSASSVQCAPADEQTITDLFDRWSGALDTRRAAIIAGHYHDDGVLVPPISGEIRNGQTEIARYFESFLKRNPQVSVEQRSIRLDCNHATDTGVYTYVLDHDGQTTTVKARYSFVYAFRNGEWRISSHHSSAMPSGPDTIAAK